MAESSTKEFLDPRVISKRHDPEGRNITADTILQSRREARSLQEGITSAAQRAKESDQRADEWSEERVRQGRLLFKEQRKTLVKLKHKLHIKDAGVTARKARAQALDRDIAEEQLTSQQVQAEEEELKRKLINLPKGKEILAAYYAKMETTPLTNQEKRELLKPEVLAELTEQEYIALWRRLNPYFLSHVTRQGFRDHADMQYHENGLKGYTNGFESVLQDQKLLRPAIFLEGLVDRDEQTIRNYLKWVLKAKDQTNAQERLFNLLNFSWARDPNYPDKTSVHFAVQVVSDNYYGAERNNEVFFLFPADVLASQYDFHYDVPDLTVPNPEQKWNNGLVWPSDYRNPGIPINSGIAFLPSKTPVDPETGSKYASKIEIIDGKETRVMIEDTEVRAGFEKMVEALPNNEKLKVALEGKDDELTLRVIYETLASAGLAPDAAQTFTSTMKTDLIQFGVDGTAILLDDFNKSCAHFRRAEKTVPAKAYWESYFEKNPSLRPAHIEYYQGNPTTAVYIFEQRNGIGVADTSAAEGSLLGFSEHYIGRLGGDQRAWRGYYDLMDKGNQIIANHYAA